MTLALDDKSLVVKSLQETLGDDHVVTDPAERQFFSADIFFEAEAPEIVIQPANEKELARAISVATDAGMAVYPRGGGISYTAGYLPTGPGGIVVDMRRMNQIIEINTDDMYVTVEAGCTWKDLYEALKKKGVRTPYFGPVSGMYATIGGTLSQNSLWFGSGLYGTVAESVLGLRVVLANGSGITLGSAATPHDPSPFFRSYGPDLVGLFLSDTGALGIKVRATLKVIPWPEVEMYASFAYESYEAVASAIAEIGKRGLAAECMGLDPYQQHVRMKRAGLMKDLETLAGVARSGRSVLDGVKKAASVAAHGRRFLDKVGYAMHVVVEGRDEASTKGALDAVRKLALREGREIPNSLPKVFRSTPFAAPNTILGPDGQRWVPVHAIVPNSRYVATIGRIHQYFEDNAAVMAEHGIEWGYVMSACGQQACLVEPTFFWEDARKAIHEYFVEDSHLATLEKFPENLAARETVLKLRSGLADLFMELGAVHLQIGRLYRYKEGREPETFDLLKAIKAYVDPKGLMNPGSLGLT